MSNEAPNSIPITPAGEGYNGGFTPQQVAAMIGQGATKLQQLDVAWPRGAVYTWPGISTQNARQLLEKMGEQYAYFDRNRGRANRAIYLSRQEAEAALFILSSATAGTSNPNAEAVVGGASTVLSDIGELEGSLARLGEGITAYHNLIELARVILDRIDEDLGTMQSQADTIFNHTQKAKEDADAYKGVL